MSYSLQLQKESSELPVDLDLIRKHFNIPPQQNDEYIEKILRIAISQAETYTDRSIVQKTWCYINKQIKVYLPKSPITNIISVETCNSNSSNFRATKFFDQIIHTDYRTIILDKRFLNKKIRITYDAGFTKETLPQSILQYIFQQFDVIYSGTTVIEDQIKYNSVLLNSYKSMSNKF
ncbi:phage head-tail connector protein [Candidatus Cytomitobacter primus]|uniref:Phage gp6-like head-tail connector protein n=1 Tax=Candidatus Cytomitobacter primus TaxID=2066024 RepID=A0A5C0UHV1_9PROT|nr:phage head-tail connector protein [Candidatus Cytomitobacter primus]QEK38524.1 hypothetical protein FZC34_01205 [Candidatus Cytomitobacter primus]